MKLRPINSSDAQRCGEIFNVAFTGIAEKHGFAPEFPDPKAGPALMSMLLGHPNFYGVVAEEGGRVVGSNFLDERSTIAGVGPITVDPSAQNKSVGKELMRAVLDRAKEKDFPGVRLLQAAYHSRSMSLYAKLGFVVREPLEVMTGTPPIHAAPKGAAVRAATERDIDACDKLCLQIHGHNRHGDLMESIAQGSATVVDRHGRISGYASLIGFFGHAVGESNDDLKSLICAAPRFAGPGFMVPTRNAELFRWCLENGLRVVQPMTLMSVGLYNEPAGAFLPSILY
jgi:GNAT superfamily N-acetyltransferase